jgi:hypothetical protein
VSWLSTDAEVRKPGERTGLDTPVVLAVNDDHQVCGVSTLCVPELTHEVVRLGSTVARLKLKGIDGDPHKQRSVWFNSMRRAEPYQGLTCAGSPVRAGSLRGRRTGAAWLSSARAVRCWVKSRNERNPCRRLHFSDETAAINAEEGGDDVKSARPLHPGRHTRYNGRYNEWPTREGELI